MFFLFLFHFRHQTSHKRPNWQLPATYHVLHSLRLESQSEHPNNGMCTHLIRHFVCYRCKRRVDTRYLTLKCSAFDPSIQAHRHRGHCGTLTAHEESHDGDYQCIDCKGRMYKGTMPFSER